MPIAGAGGLSHNDEFIVQTNRTGKMMTGVRTRNLLPTKYANPQKSPLTAVISVDQETDLKFALGD